MRHSSCIIFVLALAAAAFIASCNGQDTEQQQQQQPASPAETYPPTAAPALQPPGYDLDNNEPSEAPIAEGPGSGRGNRVPDRKRMSHVVHENMAKVFAARKELFNSFDVDKDGMLTVAEFSVAQKSADNETTDAEVNEIFEDDDVNADGKISFEEWEMALNQGVQRFAWGAGGSGSGAGMGVDPVVQYRHTFDSFDIDNNGILTQDEVQKAFSDEAGVIDKSWKKHDRNGDGKLTFEEYLQTIYARSWDSMHNDEDSEHVENEDDDDDDDDDDEEYDEVITGQTADNEPQPPSVYDTYKSADASHACRNLPLLGMLAFMMLMCALLHVL